MELSKAEINTQIAKHFGFTESWNHPIDGMAQWSYPRDWYLSQACIPNTTIPDFIQIIEDYLKLLNKHQYGGPREYFSEAPASASL